MTELLLESWDRQAKIIDSLAGLVNETNRKAKPSSDGWTLDYQLAHIHEVRYWWLSKCMPELAKTLGDALMDDGAMGVPIEDLDEIRRQLTVSERAVREATEAGLKSGGKFGPYDNAVLFMQHMVWHEGYHAGLILLGLRLAGEDPSEEWCESHIWELWRGPEEWE
ncbi:MAG: hypothetical protein KF812_03470 [Fimbriimonadaceae bacterium]|nr:hypothetical protein [Fimbriimonadaceae bacterium]